MEERNKENFDLASKSSLESQSMPKLSLEIFDNLRNSAANANYIEHENFGHQEQNLQSLFDSTLSHNAIVDQLKPGLKISKAKTGCGYKNCVSRVGNTEEGRLSHRVIAYCPIKRADELKLKEKKAKERAEKLKMGLF